VQLPKEIIDLSRLISFSCKWRRYLIIWLSEWIELNIFWVIKASVLVMLAEKAGADNSNELIFTSGCWVNSARTLLISERSYFLVSSLKDRETLRSFTTNILIWDFSNYWDNFLASQSTTVTVSKKLEASFSFLSKLNP